jgi:DNA polymerase V
VLLDFKHGPSTSATASLGAPTQRFDLLLEAAKFLWPKVLLRGAALYRMHYIASHLQYAGAVQLGLFDPPVERDAAMRQLKQDVGTRHGRFSLRSAATLPLTEIYMDESHGYEICDVAGKTCF